MKQVSIFILIICSDKYDDKNAWPVLPRAKWPSKFLKAEESKEISKMTRQLGGGATKLLYFLLSKAYCSSPSSCLRSKF
jgi:hypothetical protein